MLDTARAKFADIVSLFADIDPSHLSGGDAHDIVAFAANVIAFGTGLQTSCARRAAECAGWRERGIRSGADWLAAVTGSSVAESRTTLELSAALRGLSSTAAAARHGELSPAKLRAVATAAAADPAAEEDLLRAAEVLAVDSLRQMAGRVRAAAAVEPEVPEAPVDLHSRRFLRVRSEGGDGMIRLTGAFTPEDGVRMLSAIRSRAAFVVDDARAANVPLESQPAYDADALVALCIGDRRRATFDGQQATPREEPVIGLVVPLEALQRGRLEPGEASDIPGVGPVSVETAGRLVADSWIRLVTRDADDLRSVTGPVRVVSDRVRAVVEQRDRHCVVPGCLNQHDLELDYWQIPLHRGGPSEPWNLCRICRLHHRLKTYEGFRLSGGPLNWRWEAPGQGDALADTS